MGMRGGALNLQTRDTGRRRGSTKTDTIFESGPRQPGLVRKAAGSATTICCCCVT